MDVDLYTLHHFTYIPALTAGGQFLRIFCFYHVDLLSSFNKDLRLFGPFRVFPLGTMAFADFSQFVVTTHFFE